MNAKKYLNSRLGKTIEKMKIAYLSGKHIIFLVTTEPEFVSEVIRSESILPLKKLVKGNGPKDKSEQTNLEFLDNNKELPKIRHLEEPFIFVYQLGKSSLDKIEAYLSKYVNLCCGFSYINENLTPNEKERIENLCQSLILVVVDSKINVPLYLDPYSEVVTVPYVTKEEFDEIVSLQVNELDGEALVSNTEGYLTIKDSMYLGKLYDHMRGLNTTQIICALRKIKSLRGKIYFSSVDKAGEEGMNVLLTDVRKESERIIAASSALTLVEPNDKKPVGMDAIDKWISEHKKEMVDFSYNKKNIIKAPKGILVSGVPGTGKSMMANHIAKELNLSLVKMDLGDVLGKYVGESEENMNTALSTVEALSPCILWVDEMDKAFAGVSSDNGNGNEVTKRVFGKFLTWMQEKENRDVSCFVYATANDISLLPPELFRSGRFDEKFCVFMPTADECADMFESIINYQCKVYREQNSYNSQLLPLFDTENVNARTFKKEILEKPKVCIDGEPEKNDLQSTNRNKFFIGSDIEQLVAKAKTRYYYNEGLKKGNSNTSVFDRDELIKNKSKTALINSELFFDCIREVLKETRTYGETNLKDIARCFCRLASNNFVKASSKDIVPFEGFNDLALFQDNKGKLYDLGKEDEEKTLEKLKLAGIYDHQLYLVIRNAINNMGKELIKEYK